MFIGGSPMGTAGGVKTVTVAVLLLYAYSYIRSRRDAVVFRRGITWELAQKAVAILIASLLLSLCATIALAAAERLSLTDAMFEVFSATGTVGLSRGVTPNLHAFGRILIIICMYLGRIGPVSLALFFRTDAESGSEVRFSSGHFYVG